MIELTKEQERKLLLIVFKENKYAYGYNSLQKNLHKEIFKNLGLSSKNILNQFPIIKIDYYQDVHEREYKIDIKNHPEGISWCEHDMLEKKNYTFCCLCGYSIPEVEINCWYDIRKTWNGIKKIFRKFFK